MLRLLVQRRQGQPRRGPWKGKSSCSSLSLVRTSTMTTNATTFHPHPPQQVQSQSQRRGFHYRNLPADDPFGEKASMSGRDYVVESTFGAMDPEAFEQALASKEVQTSHFGHESAKVAMMMRKAAAKVHQEQRQQQDMKKDDATSTSSSPGAKNPLANTTYTTYEDYVRREVLLTEYGADPKAEEGYGAPSSNATGMEMEESVPSPAKNRNNNAEAKGTVRSTSASKSSNCTNNKMAQRRLRMRDMCAEAGDFFFFDKDAAANTKAPTSSAKALSSSLAPEEEEEEQMLQISAAGRQWIEQPELEIPAGAQIYRPPPASLSTANTNGNSTSNNKPEEEGEGEGYDEDDSMMTVAAPPVPDCFTLSSSPQVIAAIDAGNAAVDSLNEEVVAAGAVAGAVIEEPTTTNASHTPAATDAHTTDAVQEDAMDAAEDMPYRLPATDPSTWSTDDVVAWLEGFAEEGTMDDDMCNAFRMVNVTGHTLLHKVMPPELFKIMRRWHLQRSKPETRAQAEALVVSKELVQNTIYLCFPYCR